MIRPSSDKSEHEFDRSGKFVGQKFKSYDATFTGTKIRFFVTNTSGKQAAAAIRNKDAELVKIGEHVEIDGRIWAVADRYRGQGGGVVFHGKGTTADVDKLTIIVNAVRGAWDIVAYDWVAARLSEEGIYNPDLDILKVCVQRAKKMTFAQLLDDFKAALVAGKRAESGNGDGGNVGGDLGSGL